KFPTLNENVPVVILYAEIGTKDFVKFHKVLSEKAQKEEIVYVLRHYVQKPSPRKMYLSGYGVELAIKSTEYKAVDDIQVKATNDTTEEGDDETEEVQGFLFGKLKQMYPDLKDNLKELRKHLIQSTNNLEPLKIWELQDLSFQAASQIISAPAYKALKLMKDLAQNYPIKARYDKIVSIFSTFPFKHFREILGIQPGEAHLFLNGLPIDLDFHDPFSILETLKLEGKVMHGLHDLGLKEEAISKFMKLQIHPMDDSCALDIRHTSIIWVNNIEKDDSYNMWPTSFQELLKQTFPGDIRQIRRNLYNLVLFIDPVQEYAADFVKLAELFYHHNIPLRIGFVFILNTNEEIDGTMDSGVALLRAFNYIAEESDTTQAFISMINVNGEVLTVKHVKNVLRSEFPHADIQSILGVDSDYDEKRKAGATFYKKTGLGPLPQALFNGVPFNSEEMDAVELETVILQKITDAMGFFQKAVFMGVLNDHMDAVDFLMDQSNVVSRINPTVLGNKRRYINLISTSVPVGVEDISTFSFLDSQDKSAVISQNMKYLTKKGKFILYNLLTIVTGVGPVTIWIIADFDKPAGRHLLFRALKHLKTSRHTRLGIVNNPVSKITDDNTAIARAIMTAFLTEKNSSLKSFLHKIAKEETAKALAAGTKITKLLVPGMDDNTFEKKYNTLGVDIIQTHQMFCREVLKLLPGQMAVVSNGRVLGPLNENEFYTEDFHLLEKITFSTSAEKIKGVVKEMGVNSQKPVDACYFHKFNLEFFISFMLISFFNSLVKIDPQQNEPFYDVVAIVDPLTREAQKMAHLLIVLGNIVNMKLRLFMNSRSKLSEVPLKSFYRFVLEPELTSGANNHFPSGPVAKFLDMPETLLFTLNMIVPESWLVEAVNSSYDLDNIHLQDVEGIVTADYELEYLLLEGHCFDVTTGQPPRGLQFTLGIKNNPVMVDTTVMANLGYFQLKANPGSWTLRLRKGRSDDIYHILLHEGADSPVHLEDVIVVLNNFRGKILKVQVQKKPNKIDEDLLSDGVTEEEGAWKSITSFSGGIPTEEKKKTDVLNIFSVASGHLYERFLRIMMLSVLRHTKTPVKFWFLKNYLSPTFKEIIPHMANKYGFQYELVQYKWPRWLHQQTEKQRIIWGYKILFLDVLFPLAVDKIIFVDADQVVRSDLKELRDLDLNGAPYGYAPFCDSRTEMDGYRFWKSGYWASHLGRRKYHISALYVVDLKTFRKIAAGDRLRGQYQALSQDPNSLSNLDQDLPNNMIHQVAIKSLPQEWLWCETWCDDESKKKAKTIDLCNNPKTKEPKLKAALRIVPEWAQYDSEIRKLIKRIGKEKKNLTRSSRKGKRINFLNLISSV
uniref:UDP-glucose ceramide glucosyltransferase-like 1 n=1 Tax=Pelusios castaneus TaxID=367368 RepID=A0A8C8SUR8_9SAUR